MSHETLALLLWSMLGLSFALAIAGIAARASWPLFVAATLAFVFAVAAMFSIGIFILALVLGELALGIAIHKSERHETQR